MLVLLIAFITVVEYLRHFSGRSYTRFGGTADPQLKPTPGTYSSRNFTQYLMILAGVAVIAAGLYYGITSALLDGVKPFGIAAGSVMLVWGVVFVLRSVDRMVGEQTQELVAAIGASPITSPSDYVAVAEVDGVQLRFNITCNDQHKNGRSASLARIDYTINASCSAANGSGMKMFMYRHYAQLPLGLHPWLVSSREWAPFKVRCSSKENMPALSALHDEVAAITAARKLDLEYLYLAGNTLRARISFAVHDEENGSHAELAVSRLKGALELTAKAAAALR